MNPWNANFDELFERHLCRHSEFGINVWHLIAVAGVYFALFGLVASVPYGESFIGAGLCLYFLTLARTVPWRALAASAAFVASILGLLLSSLEISAWWYLALLVASHRCQVWQHRFYPRSSEMTRFAAKYPKGLALVALLAVYELPLLLHYFVGAGPRDVAASSGETSPP